MPSQQEMKEKVGKTLADRVVNGELIGVGTGSTVDAALLALAERVRREKIAVSVVTTSRESAWRCQEIGLTVLHSGYYGEISWGFDGADAVDNDFRLIKGKGGALLQEKILAARCRRFVVVVDQSKMVDNLATSCPVPVEIIPEARYTVERELRAIGATEIVLRPASEIG